MEDGPGGLSVADLVQRHATSRQDLTPVNPDEHPHRRASSSGEQGGRRRRRSTERQSERSERAGGRRPRETTSGSPWPDREPPAAQYPETPGRRALPEDFPPAEPHGHHGMPERPAPPPADPHPSRATGRRVTPDEYPAPNAGFGPPGDDFGASGHHAMPPAPGGRPMAPGPGQGTGNYMIPGSRQTSGGRGRSRPDDGYGAPPGYGQAAFGPGSSQADFGPGAPDPGYGSGGRPVNPGPGQFTGGGRPVIPGPGQATGAGRPVNPGPGQYTGGRPVNPGPGQFTGGGRPVIPGPGQATGAGRPVNPGPGQYTGGRPVNPGPGQFTGGGRPVIPGPGQATGGPPLPPGQSTGYGPVPGRHPSGPPPGERSLPGHPSGPLPRDPANGRPSIPGSRPGPEQPGHRTGPQRPGESSVPLPPPRDPVQDPLSMTTEMEAIGDDVKKRRGIDHTLARFSAVHDELQAEERQKKAKRRKLMPWKRQDDEEMDQLDKLVAGQTLAVQQPRQDPDDEQEPERPDRRAPMGPDGPGGGMGPDRPSLMAHERDPRYRTGDRHDGPGGMGPDRPGGMGPDRPGPMGPGPDRPGPMAHERDPRSRAGEPTSRQQRRSKFAFRAFAVSAAILVFVATGIAWGFKSWIDASARQVDALDPDSESIQDAAGQRGDENFLLVGSDTRAGEDGDDEGNAGSVRGARSDTVMIAHIPANRDRAVVISLPRDLEISRPDCEGWDPASGDYTGEEKPGEEQTKINTAYQVGGPKCVTKTVQKMSGLMINHFVGIDFSGFKGMVDAVSGVEVCVEEPLKDEVLGTIVPEGGKNVLLSGNEALNFVRARHVEGDLTSDYGRIQRQQRFLSSLLRKAMSSEVLLDPGKLTDFVDAFSKSTFGDNIGVDQMVTLGRSLQGIEAGRVTFVTVPTVGEANERGNEELRDEDTRSLFRAIREDSPLPGEQGGTQQLKAAPALTTQPGGTVDPKSIKLQVFNGGNPTGGIAGDTADKLADLGYQIVWVDAAPENVKNTVIKYAKASAAQAKTLQSSVPDSELVEDPSLGGSVQLIIGPGFDGKVAAPGGGEGQPDQDLPNDLSTINGSDGSCI